MRGILILILVFLAAAAFWFIQMPAPARPMPAPTVATPAAAPVPAPVPPTQAPVPQIALKADPAPQNVEFTQQNEITDKIVLEVGRMVRPARVRAAIEETPNGRVAFVLIDGNDRLYDGDADLLPQYESIFKDLGLNAATGIAIRTMSRYRSVTKSAMKFDEQKDRMMSIVFPSEEWQKLSLPKPASRLKALEK